eukprot:gene6265-biopygen20847
MFLAGIPLRIHIFNLDAFLAVIAFCVCSHVQPRRGIFACSYVQPRSGGFACSHIQPRCCRSGGTTREGRSGVEGYSGLSPTFEEQTCLRVSPDDSVLYCVVVAQKQFCHSACGRKMREWVAFVPPETRAGPSLTGRPKGE